MNSFELEVFSFLESCGWSVFYKGKGYDLLALKKGVALLVECKDWRKVIKGKTLRKMVRKLKKEYRKFLESDRRFSEVIPILLVSGEVDDLYRTEPVLVFDFEAFRSFVKSKS